MFNNKIFKIFKNIFTIYIMIVLVSYVFFEFIILRINYDFYMKNIIIQNRYYYFIILLLIATIILYVFFVKILKSEKKKMKEKEIEINNKKISIDEENKEILKKISNINEMNYTLENEKNYFNTVFSSIPDNIVITDKRNEIVYSNDAYKKFAGNISNDLMKSNFKFDCVNHIEINNLMFKSNVKSFELNENDIIYKKSIIKINDLDSILTIGEDKSKVKIVSDNLIKTINELRKTEDEVNLINDNLNSLLIFIFNINDIENIKIEDFLIKVFNHIYESFDKADCGSVYTIKDDKINFLDAKGHDLDKLKKITIFSNSFNISEFNKSIIYRNIMTNAKSYYYEELMVATVKSKETLKFSILKNNKIFGAISLDIKENSSEEFNDSDIQLMDLFSRLIDIIVMLVINSEENKKLTTDVLFSFVNIMKIHSIGLYNHSINVGEISKKFAMFNKLSKSEIEEAYWSGLMHDLGFLLVPSHKLAVKETVFDDIYDDHVEIAYNIMKDINGLENIANNIYHHHEKYDGSGYPNKISGEKIPFIAQIVHISNFYDMAVNIQNKEFDQFIEVLNNERNKSFNSKLIDKFIEWVKIYEIE
jgi:response regulator RpfG family c-di-GMP phosphodiesterase